MRRAHGLDRFVQGYRAQARLPSPSLRVVDLRVVLHVAATLFRGRWGARMALELEAPVYKVMVRLDPDLLDQALLNVLNNGAEAAHGGAPRVILSGYGDASRCAHRDRR